MSRLELAKQSAHILTDGVSVAYGGGGADAIEIAMARLVEIGAYSVTIAEGASNKVELDDGPIIGASMQIQLWLIAQVAEARGTTFDDVLAELREHINSM